MKLVCLSDSHCALKEYVDNNLIPDGDVLVHAGDLTYQGRLSETARELTLLGSLPHKYKIYISGNHDWLGEKNPALVDQLCADNNIIHLHDKSVTIDNIKFYGNSFQPEFCNWAFNVNRAEMQAIWENIPKDTDVLITHSPPMGILDFCRNGHVGCLDLLLKLKELNVKVHVFGHIHEGYGEQIGSSANNLKTHFVNASLMDGFYNPVNMPIVVEI